MFTLLPCMCMCVNVVQEVATITARAKEYACTIDELTKATAKMAADVATVTAERDALAAEAERLRVRYNGNAYVLVGAALLVKCLW